MWTTTLYISPKSGRRTIWGESVAFEKSKFTESTFKQEDPFERGPFTEALEGPFQTEVKGTKGGSSALEHFSCFANRKTSDRLGDYRISCCLSWKHPIIPI